MINKVIDSITRNDEGFEKARNIIPFFYYFLVATAVLFLTRWQFFLERGAYFPSWPIFWVNYLGQETALKILIALFLSSAVLGAFFFWNRIFRILAFLGIVEYHALLSSYLGKPDHTWYLFLYVAFIFIFLPDAWKKFPDIEQKRKFLLVFWGAQTFVLLTYSMSGFMKLYDAAAQLLQNQISILNPNSAALHIAYMLHIKDATSLLGPLIVERPVLGWIPFLLVIYFEFFALYVAFKPALQRFWALGLILFLHIGSYLTMDIIFQPNIFLLMLLFFSSPFISPIESFRKIILDIPIFGWVIRPFAGKIIQQP